MLKRMFLMLAVMLIVIAALGFVKFQQILDSQCSGRGVSAASSSGDDHRRGGRSGRRHCAPSARWLRCRG